MPEHMVWDSPGGLTEFMPPCTCGHPCGVHSLNARMQRKACSTWSNGVMCPCRAYTAGDPATWPGMGTRTTPPQEGLF